METNFVWEVLLVKILIKNVIKIALVIVQPVIKGILVKLLMEFAIQEMTLLVVECLLVVEGEILLVDLIMDYF